MLNGSAHSCVTPVHRVGITNLTFILAKKKQNKQQQQQQQQKKTFRKPLSWNTLRILVNNRF